MDVDGLHILEIISNKAGKYFHMMEPWDKCTETLNEKRGANCYIRKSIKKEDYQELIIFIKGLGISVIEEDGISASDYYYFGIIYKSILLYWDRIK